LIFLKIKSFKVIERKMRIQKWMAQCGLLSRRKVEQAILEGRVKLNGNVLIELGRKIDPQVDRIELDDQVFHPLKKKMLILFYKPREVITSRYDPQGRKIVHDCLPARFQRLKPVGRLDYDSEGLLLLTNDGNLAYHLTHPRFQVPKIYEVWIPRKLSHFELKKLTTRVLLEDGVSRFHQIEWIKKKENKEIYQVSICEGRNRLVRRMFVAIHLPVMRLIRRKMGNYELGDLKPGQYCELSCKNSF